MGIKAFFSAFGRKFKSFVAKAFDAVKPVLKSELGKIALAAVAELNQSNLDSGAKRKAAFDRILKEATVAGLETKDFAINWVLESAVLALKVAAEKAK